MNFFKRMARRKTLCVIVITLVSFTCSALLSLVVHPEPTVDDEFTYILMGDTFAHGRLTNPPHPMAKSLQTMFVLMEPTYQGIYPPGQGLFLALGQVLTGSPIVGVWISLALACGAICWMLYAWVPPRWALLGALFATVRLCFFGDFQQFSEAAFAYWGQSYFGGAVAALGGALVLGSVRKLDTSVRWTDAFLLGLGLSILMLSRPYESALIVAPSVLFLVYRLLKKRSSVASLGKLLVAVIPMSAAVAFWLTYNRAVTGNAFLLPYMLYLMHYTPVPLFYFQKLRPMGPRPFEQMTQINEIFEIRDHWDRAHSVFGFLSILLMRISTFWSFYFGEWLAVPFFVGLPRRNINAWHRLAIFSVMFSLAIIWSIDTYFQVHYVAAMTCLIFYLVIQGLRRMNLITSSGGQRFLLPLTLAVFASTFILSFMQPRYYEDSWFRARARIAQQLNAQPGKHLVLVRYGSRHSMFHEWIYNGADIDGSKVVWARWLDDEQNSKVLRYFKDRQAWLVDENCEAFKSCRPTLKKLRGTI